MSIIEISRLDSVLMELITKKAKIERFDVSSDCELLMHASTVFRDFHICNDTDGNFYICPNDNEIVTLPNGHKQYRGFFLCSDPDNELVDLNVECARKIVNQVIFHRREYFRFVSQPVSRIRAAFRLLELEVPPWL